MENFLKFEKNEYVKLLNLTNDSIKKRKLSELYGFSEEHSCTLIQWTPEKKINIGFQQSGIVHMKYTELDISEYLKCDVCNITNNDSTSIVNCSYCELMSELREESRKILKLKGIIDFLKKISTENRPKEYLESLIQRSMYFIYISKKNINYPEHIKIFFTNILNKNYYPFYEYFKNKNLKDEVQYFLPNNLNYYFIFLNMFILFYFKKGWGWDITLFPSDKSKIIQYIDHKGKEFKKEFDEKLEILKIEIYRLENWIF